MAKPEKAVIRLFFVLESGWCVFACAPNVPRPRRSPGNFSEPNLNYYRQCHIIWRSFIREVHLSGSIEGNEHAKISEYILYTDMRLFYWTLSLNRHPLTNYRVTQGLPITSKVSYANSIEADESPSYPASHPKTTFSQTVSDIKAFWNFKQTKHLVDDNWFAG